MNVRQLRNVLLQVPDDAELYVSFGDPIDGPVWAAYKCEYNSLLNRFYVDYMERKND